MTSIRFAFALAATATIVIGCGRPGNYEQTPESGTGTVVVYTVNYPLKYFADRIGGEHVDVVFPAPPDGDPAFWTPDASAVSAYQQADLILLNGATYAKWVSNVTLPESKLVNTTQAVKEKYISVSDAVTHSHGPGDVHSHAGTAFTTWLDPEIAIAQAGAIHQALAELRPEHSDAFKQNYEALTSDMNALGEKLEKATRDASQQPIIFSHPVYQYLQRKYGLKGESVHWEPNTLPSEDDWAKMRELLKRHPAKWMIWEGNPVDESVKQLSELGIDSIVFDPCGNMPDDGDWLQVMNRNAEELARIRSASESNLPSDH